MNELRNTVRVALLLFGLSLVGLAAAHLALTDIYHGGEPLGTEWAVVRVSLLLIFGAIASGLFVIFRMKRLMAKEQGVGNDFNK